MEHSHAPRSVLFVDRDGARRVATSARALGDPWVRLAALGGSALALALVGDAVARGRAPLVVAVGDAVQRGVPTAARAVVAGVAPRGPRHAEGHVGGDLGARLASVADALVIESPLAPDGAPVVVVVDGDAVVRVEPARALAELSTHERSAACVARFGAGATLACGPAAHRGVVFASLASGSPPSFVGRGGLGARLAALGVAALHVTADERVAPAHDEQFRRLEHLLAGSPRLVARASGGGFEQGHALAARGELAGDAAAAAQDFARWRAARDTRVGCRGCPTPCGFVFEGVIGGAAGVRGHFGATHALGDTLGLREPSERLHVLAACDRAGVDAKEMGALLELYVRACESGVVGEPAVRGDAQALARAAERLALGSDELARHAARGAEAFAAHLRLPPTPAAQLGQHFAPRFDLAALAAVVGAGAGTDPMRSFPFATDIARRRLLELLPNAPPGTERADSPSGKGLVAWWHENLVAAVDTTGFCVFSATALLADGACSLGELARAILPAQALALASDPARALLACGASVALARAELDRRLGAPRRVPAFARELVGLPGMDDLYRAARGLDAQGLPLAGALAALATERLAEPWGSVAPGAVHAVHADRATRVAAADDGASAPAPIRVFALGPLAALLGGSSAKGAALVCAFDAPPTLDELLEHIAHGSPDRERALKGSAAPSAWVDGRRVFADERVPLGARVDLVSAVFGG
jgi:aldehyde:ferredoxin oxidoreductase